MKALAIMKTMGIFLLLFAEAAFAADQVITVADVEKAGALKGIKLVPKDPKIGAGGDLNFATADNKIVLIVVARDKSLLDEMKAQKGSLDAAVAGLGDEAYNGPGFGKVRYILVVRKGNRVTSLSSFMNMAAGGKPYFTQDQLKELARKALARM
jgi:hypothetical protein